MDKAAIPPFGSRLRLTVGLLGGSFNPAHEGHLHFSRRAKRALGLDQVWWLVSPQNPLKPVQGMGRFEERLDRARRTAAKDAFIRVTDLEKRLGVRYSADTVAAVKKRLPCMKFVWLMGADNLSQLPKWRGWTRLMRLVPVAVMARPTYSLPALAGKAALRYRGQRQNPERLAKASPPAWCFLWLAQHPAAASRIRAAKLEP